jgi:hypothetical protein
MGKQYNTVEKRRRRERRIKRKKQEALESGARGVRVTRRVVLRQSRPRPRSEGAGSS